MTTQKAVEFSDWVARAKPGERVIYHVGFLANDRDSQIKGSRDVDAVATKAAQLCKKGMIHLCQAKTAAIGNYAYLAVRSRQA